MAPKGQASGNTPLNNLYTAILAVAVAVVISTAAYVAFMCYTQYEEFAILP